MNAQQISWLPEEVRNHIAQLERDLARLTAENERLENLAATLAANLAKASKRNAELVEQLKAYGKYAHDTTLEDQNAELVAALRDVADSPNTIISEALYHQIDILLARHRAKQEVKS